MVTIYHKVNPPDWYQAEPQKQSAPPLQELELIGVALETNDLDEAFDLTIHRDGENWTDGSAVMVFGDRRSRRSSQEGDVFVTGEGTAHLVLTQGFKPLLGMLLPFL